MCPYGKWCNDQQDILISSSRSLKQSKSMRCFKVLYCFFDVPHLQVIPEKAGKAFQILTFCNEVYVVILL